LERKAVYTFRARIAAQWRKDRVLLAGDAAHQTPPFAGQGMCSGLRDAANLAWKLAEVVTGKAPDSLLDSYQPEREPNVRATIEMAIMMGRTVCITSKWGAWMRDLKFKLARILRKLPDGPPVYPPITAGIILSGCAVAGSYFPQFVSREGAKLDDIVGAEPWLLSQTGLDRQDFAPALRDWLNQTGTDAALIRPDRYLFGAADGPSLNLAWQAQTAMVAQGA
jgi:3-(3-hydroxy-phenyl)propionate hydroxylase